MRVWTSDDVLFLLMRNLLQKISTHEPRLLLMITQAQNSMPQEYSRHWQDSIFELFSLTCEQILQNFPGCDYPQSKAYRCLSRVEFHSVFFEQVAMTVVKLYPDPHGLSTWPLQTLQRLLSFVTDPAYTQFSGVPLITVGLKRCRFVQEDNQKKFENIWKLLTRRYFRYS